MEILKHKGAVYGALAVVALALVVGAIVATGGDDDRSLVNPTSEQDQDVAQEERYLRILGGSIPYPRGELVRSGHEACEILDIYSGDPVAYTNAVIGGGGTGPNDLAVWWTYAEAASQTFCVRWRGIDFSRVQVG